MAKIKVFETTKSVKSNAVELAKKLDSFRVDIDHYLKLVSSARDKAENELRALEEKRRLEELALKQAEEARLKEEQEKKEKVWQTKFLKRYKN